MRTIGEIFDILFCLNKSVNGIIYNDDFQKDIKYRFYTSRYLMDQVFNYVFKDTFEQLDPAHGAPDRDMLRKVINTRNEAKEICTLITTKIEAIIQAMHCVLRDCNPMHYGQDYVHDTIFKHEKKLSYKNLENPSIYKHHVALRDQDRNKNSNQAEKTGDWLVYVKSGNLIKFIMVCQHPDILPNSLSKINPITSENKNKVDQYCSDRDNHQKISERFIWTMNDIKYFIQKISSRLDNIPSKHYQQMKSESHELHKNLISASVNWLLENDPILVQNN
jgi:hypothetical protein